jgi:hypothetical protein
VMGEIADQLDGALHRIGRDDVGVGVVGEGDERGQPGELAVELWSTTARSGAGRSRSTPGYSLKPRMRGTREARPARRRGRR